MQNQNEYIDRLLQRYWNCETTVAEEQELRDFFSQEDLPEAYQPYAPLLPTCGKSRLSP